MITIRQFTAEDIPFGISLKKQASWNQVSGDWERLLALNPDSGFLAEWDTQPAGTVMVTRFDEVAWISMMLVEKSLRGRGIGRALMQAALNFCERTGMNTVRLDATPLGQPLYQKLGFRPDYSLVRYAGVPHAPRREIETQSIPVEYASEIDHQVTGTNRRSLLAHLEAESGLHGLNSGETGFVTWRQGCDAVQIGPCIGNESAGAELLSFAFQRHAGRMVYVDIPSPNSAAAEFVLQQGLSPQRTLTRMTRGSKVTERPEWLWGTFGPEKG